MSEMLSITLPDGSVREVARGTTPADVAAAIGPGLAKAALAARVNGEVRDLARPFEGDAELALITARDEADALELVRHDYAHVLAEAVQNLFPGTQITFGPATEDGFYYDFAPTPERGPFTDEDLPAIEEEMRRDHRAPTSRWSARSGRATRSATSSRSRARRFKAEWVMELPDGRGDHHVPVRRAGSTCAAGPHLASTGKLDPAGVQADARLGRLLARRPEERDAVAHLRHRLAQQEAARRASRPARGGGQARPPQDRPGDGPVPPPGGGARLGLLAPQGLCRSGAQLEAYMRRRLDAAGYRRGQDAAADGRAAVGGVRPLGQVSREHVRRPRRGPGHRGGRAGPVRRRAI